MLKMNFKMYLTALFFFFADNETKVCIIDHIYANWENIKMLMISLFRFFLFSVRIFLHLSQKSGLNHSQLEQRVIEPVM